MPRRTGETERCHNTQESQSSRELFRKMCPADPSSEPHFLQQRNVKNPLDPHWPELRGKHLSPCSHWFELRARLASPISKHRLPVYHLGVLVHPSPRGDPLGSPGGSFLSLDASERFKTMTKKKKTKTTKQQTKPKLKIYLANCELQAMQSSEET